MPIVVALASGCGSLPFQHVSDAPVRAVGAKDERLDRVVAREGLALLEQRRFEDASRIFNVGLKFAPQDAQLHFLNGLTYHLQYLAGNDRVLGLAVAGYELALTHEPAHYHAAIQLGRLQFAAKQYAKAIEAFRRAAEIDTRSGEAYVGLASAAYYAHDVAGAWSAAERAATLLPASTDALRTLALTRAAAGHPKEAQRASLRYASLESNSRERARLDSRLRQWADWHAATGQSKDRPAPDAAADPRPEVKAPSKPQAEPPAAEQQKPAAGSARKAWYDCAGSGTDPSQSPFGAGTPGSQSISSGDFGDSQPDIGPMPALPSPCQGAGIPPMALLDVVFIRTEDSASTSHGQNLLQTLTYAFGVNRTIQDITRQNDGVGSRDITVTRTRQRGTGAVDSLITYSLNIANATDNRSEVLAKPSLVALDRVPSTFFSGRNVTLGVSGQAGGASIVTDRPIGVGLAVTPTFIDGETLALAVRVQRSFIEEVNLDVNFNQSLLQSRNSVTANVVLKMGQTLILSGLSEQETQRASSGVPVLKDVPLLQYLFSQKTTQNFTSSVLVLITPRAPTTDRDAMTRTLSHVDTLPDPEKRKYRTLIEKAMQADRGSMPDNIDATYRHAYGNTLFLQFRSGDLSLQHWSQPPRLDEFFRDLKELLYY